MYRNDWKGNLPPPGPWPRAAPPARPGTRQSPSVLTRSALNATVALRLQLLLAHLSRQLHSHLTLVSCVENFIFPNTDQFLRDSIRFHRLACNPAEYSVHAHGPHGPRGALGARLECCPGAPGIPAGRFEERPSTLQMYFTKGNGPLSMKWP